MPQRVNSSTRRPVPYRSVGLAVLLVVLGLTMLVSGLILCLTSEDAALGVLKGWSLIILGSIVFVPGAYVARIAAYAWLGRKGYRYEDIPDD